MSDFKPLTPTPGELDRMGSALWSRWISSKSGRTLIVVNRAIHSDGSYLITVLDVDQEQPTDVRAEDWQRWIREKKVYRKR